jgi:hypothetical protein
MTILGPTTFYHRTKRPCTVTTEAEYEALGEGWADTPAAFYDPPADIDESPAPAVAPSDPVPARPRRGRPRRVKETP